jgi:hypothetical protein
MVKTGKELRNASDKLLAFLGSLAVWIGSYLPMSRDNIFVTSSRDSLSNHLKLIDPCKWN